MATTVGAQTINYVQPFFITFAATPQVAIGLIIMDFDSSTSQQGFNVNIGSITKTQFTSTITVNAGTTINELRYMYFGIDPSQNLGTVYLIDESFAVLNSNTDINAT